MVVMRCISVQQIVRSDIQAGRKILQQLNRAAAVSRFNFCKMVRTNVQHYTQLFLRNPLLFPQIADSNSTLFHKSEFAHKLPQSIFSVKSFFAAERDKFTQQTHKNEYLHSNYTYFTIHSFQKHQYVLVCSATISNFLRFSQVSFSRFNAKIKRCQRLTNAYNVPTHFIHPIYTQFRTKRTA